jgi:hypothetical protein
MHRHAILGCILVKELAWIDKSEPMPVANLKMRSIPTLPASIALYDLLRLFRVTESLDQHDAAVHTMKTHDIAATAANSER